MKLFDGIGLDFDLETQNTGENFRSFIDSEIREGYRIKKLHSISNTFGIRITPNTFLRIALLLKEGHPYHRVADALHVHFLTARKVRNILWNELSKRNIPLPLCPCGLAASHIGSCTDLYSSPKKEQAIILIQQGIKAKVIARKIGLDRETVKKIQKRFCPDVKCLCGKSYTHRGCCYGKYHISKIQSK